MDLSERQYKSQYFNTENKLTESDHDSQLSSIVGNSTHEPVSGRLPHGVKESEENVQEDSSNISFIEDVDALETRCVTGVLARIGVLTMNEKACDLATHIW